MSKIEGAPFEEKVALCALNRIFGFEPKIGLRLVETLGSATAVFKEPGEVARALGVCSRNRYDKALNVLTSTEAYFTFAAT